MGEAYVCADCGYRWTSRRDFGKPAFCPSCRSREIKVPLRSSKQGEGFFGNLFEGLGLSGEMKTLKAEFGKYDEEDDAKEVRKIYATMKASGVCNYCGKSVEKEGGYEAQCAQGGWGCDKFLCKKCAKTCKNCGKIFCPEHIKKHRC